MNNGVDSFTAESVAELRKNIDFSDIPELTAEDFKGGWLRNYTPKKKAVSIRLDLDNLEWLKEGGKGYQSRLNKLIRWARQNHCPIETL